MRKLAFGFVLSAMCLGAQSAQAVSSISFTDTIPDTTTNWDLSVNLGKFDTNLGTLCKITFTIRGEVSGNISLESLDNAPSTVNATLAATITLYRLDNSALVAVVPAVMTTDNFSAFDGVVNFGGTSGNQYLGLSSSAMEMAMSAPPTAQDLIDYTASGGGALVLSVDAMANSTASGAGNLVTIFQTIAGARVTVRYEYKPNVVPEPATVVSAGLGLLGVGLVGLRRRAKTA